MPVPDKFFLFFVNLVGVEDHFSNEFQRTGFGIDFSVKAGLVADVALAGIDGDFQKDAILVAVDEDLVNLLEMA